MDNPKISVVTVVYNMVDKIENTILSVINQTYSNIEYIIIDGCSTDGTVDIIKKYADKIHYWVSEADKGVYDAMSKGISKATGKWVNFMNAGDQLYSSTVLQNIFFNNIPDTISVIYGDTVKSFPFGYYSFNINPLSDLEKGMIFCHQSTFVRYNILQEMAFDKNFKISADYNLFYNLYKRKHEFLYIPIYISIYEVAEDSISNSSKLIKEEFIINQNKGIYYKRFIRKKLGCILYAILPSQIEKKVKKNRITKGGIEKVL